MHFAWTFQAICPPRYCTCTAKGLKPLILFKDEVKEMDTLFEAQLKKIISSSRKKKQKLSMARMGQQCYFYFCDTQEV